MTREAQNLTGAFAALLPPTASGISARDPPRLVAVVNV
jgi:hypothetical protein